MVLYLFNRPDRWETKVPLPGKNMLVDETSPYLLQHKDNPVHWRAWSEDALEEAKSLGRPILLSIGYAACHWCHVMAEECFEDDEVAAVMNRLFVNIKVDREERPDIDQIYMTALTAMGEQGGWPLTMFLTPDQQPFWGGTYFPKTPRYGRPGFLQVLTAVHTAWQEKEHDLRKSANTLATHVKQQLAPVGAEQGPKEPPLAEFAGKISSMIDPLNGGLRGAPKFPNVPFLDILWMDWLENGAKESRDAALLTLRHMFAGGIYDHVGGGLSRYSTDADWLVPHFEKMLYDNAQLIRLASYAYGETRDPIFRQRIEETVDWMMREMHLPDGTFASSLDADSEGEEGKFYLWSQEEVEEVLGAESDLFFSVYRLSTTPEWKGNPILNRAGHPEALSEGEEKNLRNLLQKLFERRRQRTPPKRDDKVLVDWNGLAISALAMAGRQFERPDWIEIANTVFHSIRASMIEDRLPHAIRGVSRVFPAMSSDYAAMISAAVALYEAVQDPQFLEQAKKWATMLDRWYADENGTGYYLTAKDSVDVPMRIRGDVDEAVPSATAQVIIALTQLSRITGDEKLTKKAEAIAAAALSRSLDRPYGQAGIIYAASLTRKPLQLLIHDPTGTELVSVANRIPDPRRTDLLLEREEGPVERALGIKINRQISAAYLCIGQTCLPPLRDAASLEAALRSTQTAKMH